MDYSDSMNRETQGEIEIELVADERGLAVFGPQAAVERFLESEGLTPEPRTQDGLGMRRMRSLLSAGSAVADAGSQIAEHSGRWVKLTKESAAAIEKHGLRESASGLSTGVLRGEKGQIRGFVEFARRPGAGLTNPARLAGAASVMAQLAMQQSMAEITDYLERIDVKLDAVLRGQRDAKISGLIGVGMAIDEAMTVSNARGKVDEVTWSKVQNLSSTIADVQAYALLQLDGIAESLEKARKISDVSEAATDAARATREWLAVLARSFQLQDALDVLELDRVLETAPLEVDAHRAGLGSARAERRITIQQRTESLLARIEDAAALANAKVLLHPSRSPEAANASLAAQQTILDFHRALDLETKADAVGVRRWRQAAGEARDRALEAGADRAESIRQNSGTAAMRMRDGARSGSESARALAARLRARGQGT